MQIEVSIRVLSTAPHSQDLLAQVKQEATVTWPKAPSYGELGHGEPRPAENWAAAPSVLAAAAATALDEAQHAVVELREHDIARVDAEVMAKQEAEAAKAAQADAPAEKAGVTP